MLTAGLTYTWRATAYNAAGYADSLLESATFHVAAADADADGDGDRDLLDYAELQVCFTGPGPTVLAPGCEVFDLEPDQDVDLDDLEPFVAALDGP